MVPFQMMAKPYVAQGTMQGTVAYHFGGNCSPLKGKYRNSSDRQFLKSRIISEKKTASRTDPHLHPERDWVCLLKPAGELVKHAATGNTFAIL
jgi:hypothetical protein